MPRTPELAVMEDVETQDGLSVGLVPTLLKDIFDKPRIDQYIREINIHTLIEMSFNSIRSKTSGEVRALYKRQRDLVDAAVAQSDVPEVRH